MQYAQSWINLYNFISENSEGIINLLGALASLATVGAFLFLWKKDESKQEQIDKLAGVVVAIESQNDTMIKGNDLMEQQISVLRDMGLNGGADSDGSIKLAEIDNKRLKLSVMPKLIQHHIWVEGNRNRIDITIKNLGEEARIIDIKNNLGLQSVSPNSPYPIEILKGKGIVFSCYGPTGFFVSGQFEIEIIYEDKIDTHYSLKINGVGMKLIFEKPIEI